MIIYNKNRDKFLIPYSIKTDAVTLYFYNVYILYYIQINSFVYVYMNIVVVFLDYLFIMHIRMYVDIKM